jgi:hypothetical protein
MKNVKQEVLRIIKSLPSKVTVDDIMHELYFKVQVDAAIGELDAGKGITHELAKKRFSKWLSR